MEALEILKHEAKKNNSFLFTDRGKLIHIYNPIKYIKSFYPSSDISHISYNPEVEKEYEIIRGMVYDGTLLLRLDLIKEVLSNIVSRTSFCTVTSYPPEFDEKKIETFNKMHYEIGDLYCYEINRGGLIPSGEYGMRERIVLPIRTHYKI